jgi:NADH dehydrogenase FAD-containing subunit
MQSPCADRPVRVIVLGAGAGGVEIAFTLLARLGRAGLEPRVTLLDGGARILPGYPDSLVARVLRQARSRGVEVRTGVRAVAVEPGRLVLAELAADIGPLLHAGDRAAAPR